MISIGEIRQMYRAVGPIVKKAILSGRILKPRCELTEPHPDILTEYDVEIPLENGLFVTANIFRSKSADAAKQRLPVIMCAHPYDNHLIPALGKTPLGGAPQQYRIIPQEGKPTFSTQTSWESPDPNFWVPAGYAVVNMNMPGYSNSQGKPTIFGPDQSDSFGQAIDWVGSRSWCTGKVGLSGVSYLAMSQYGVAAGETPRGVPKCLKAISPWEGVENFYHDLFREGGIKETGFPVFWWHTEVKPTINCSEEEFIENEGQLPAALLEAHPFYDDYWKGKVADTRNIELPMLICASFSDQGLHTRPSFRIFQKARSENKWVYTHRSLKWDAYYSREVQELTKSFFDCFLKDSSDNGFLENEPVRLEVRSSRDVIHEVRGESEWPLARTQYTKLFLRENLQLSTEPGSKYEFQYDARSQQLRLKYTFDQDTEITGYMKLRVWVEARGDNKTPVPPDDMAIFVGVDKLDREGNRVPFYGSVGNFEDLLTRGLLSVARRALDTELSTTWEPFLLGSIHEPLAPGDIVSAEIGLNPSSTHFFAGEAMELIISPGVIVSSPPYIKDNSCNRGQHVIHTGGEFDSHLLIPVIPPS